MNCNLVSFAEWSYIVSIAVFVCFIITFLYCMVKSSIDTNCLAIICTSTIFLFCFLIYVLSSDLTKLRSLKEEGSYSYVIEIPEKLFSDSRFTYSKVLVSSFCIHSDGLVSFNYTTTAEKIGTKYQYNNPAQYPAESRIYKGYYNRIYSIKEGRYLLSRDLAKYVAKEDKK